MPPRGDGAPTVGVTLPSHYQSCYVCGQSHPAGLHMTMTAGEGLTVTARFTVTTDHQGAPGLAHGGLLSAAFDEVFGGLAWLLMQPAVTARLEVDFVRPVPVGTTLHLVAEVTGRHGRKVYTAGVARSGSPEGPVAATASGLFVQVPLEHFAQHGRPEDVRAAAAGDHGPRRPWLEINP